MIVAEHEHNSPNQQRGIVVSSYSKQKQEEKNTSKIIIYKLYSATK